MLSKSELRGIEGDAPSNAEPEVDDWDDEADFEDDRPVDLNLFDG